MNYSEKLKSPKWQKKRLEILQRDNFKCCLCSDEETELHIHHIKYTGPNPENAPNEDLETLCKDCHSLKTFQKESVHGKFVKAFKYDKVIVALVDNNGIAIFFFENGKPEHCISFKENSICLSKIIDFTNEHWTNKNK